MSLGELRAGRTAMLDKTPAISRTVADWTRKRERWELETYDEYSMVILRLDDSTRVIECKDGIQWIVQRASRRGDGRVWAGVSFCRTREALLRCVREWVPGEHPALEALPERHPG